MNPLLLRVLLPALVVRASGVAPTEPREPAENAQLIGYLVLGGLLVVILFVGLLIYRRLR